MPYFCTARPTRQGLAGFLRPFHDAPRPIRPSGHQKKMPEEACFVPQLHSYET